MLSSFAGFLPAKAGQRRTALEELGKIQHTVVVYEAPHRIGETLEDIVAILGPEQQIVIARELTKVHEEFIRGTAAEVLEQTRRRELKGEITVLIGSSLGRTTIASAKTAAARLPEIVTEQKVDQKTALKILAKERSVSKSELYREVQRQKKSRA